MASKRPNKDVSPKGSHTLRSRRVGEEDDDNENDQSPGGMSLDVLAQVASETLKNEPNSGRKAQKRVSLRSIGCVEVLTLDQILGLTDRTMLKMFCDSTSNEMAKTFTVICQLMPQECQQEFTSFGSDMRARNEMKKHLYAHLSDLEKDASKKVKFTAEPVNVRRKRLMSAFMPAKRSVHKNKSKSSSQGMDSGRDKSRKNTSGNELTYMRSKKSANVENDTEEAMKLLEDDNSTVNSIGFVPVADKLRTNAVTKEDLQKKLKIPAVPDSPDSDEENERRIEENEQFIIDLLSKTQPHHDHSYTTIFGQRRRCAEAEAEEMKQPEATSSLMDNFNGVFLKSTSGQKKPTPILFLRHRSPDENVPMVSAEEIIEKDGAEKEEEEVVEEEEKMEKKETESTPMHVSSGEKPYPPMPKSMLAQRGRLGFDISDIPMDGSDDELEYLKKKKKSLNPLGREGREGNLGWEPKLALRYIRELKGRKKDESITLKCKICNDKTFTAAATLMYHYRSHAGIKPFVCLICNTTFTRQHSLNYHMLIHNNQSRFTCKDCGRKFRHPSHFKEHLRRHTGETPFECLDCLQRFKTRNTYKRHLKTRHGKLLTASGIHELSREEFAKVRTKRYNIPRLPDISYEMPELTFTKLKRYKKAEEKAAEDGKVIDLNKELNGEELKLMKEIKKEIESDTEDPELDNILQVLDEVEKDKTAASKEAAGTDSQFTAGMLVNKKFSGVQALAVK